MGSGKTHTCWSSGALTGLFALLAVCLFALTDSQARVPDEPLTCVVSAASHADSPGRAAHERPTHSFSVVALPGARLVLPPVGFTYALSAEPASLRWLTVYRLPGQPVASQTHCSGHARLLPCENPINAP